jgi:hypothetical protein
MTNPLSTAIVELELEPALTDQLINAFGPAFVAARDLTTDSKSIVVTDATQLTEMKAAREARIKIGKVRTGAEKLRKEMKDQYLRGGKAVDKVAKVIELICEPEEARLEEAEKFAERAEAKRKAELADARKVLLAPYGVDTAFLNLADMPQGNFEALLSQSKLAYEARIEAERKRVAEEEAARVAKAAEDARIRAENERLRKEREEADRLRKIEEAAREKERQEALEQLQAAHRERERVEREAREQREAAERKERERLAAEKREREARELADRQAKEAADLSARKAAAAPDADKLIAWANAVQSVAMPELAGEQAKALGVSYVKRLAGFLDSVRNDANAMK